MPHSERRYCPSSTLAASARYAVGMPYGAKTSVKATVPDPPVVTAVTGTHSPWLVTRSTVTRVPGAAVTPTRMPRRPGRASTDGTGGAVHATVNGRVAQDDQEPPVCWTRTCAS